MRGGKFLARLLQIGLETILLYLEPVQLHTGFAQAIALAGRRLEVFAQFVQLFLRLLGVGPPPGRFLQGQGQFLLLSLQLLISAVRMPGGRNEPPPHGNLHGGIGHLGNDQRAPAIWAIDLHPAGAFVHGDLLVAFRALETNISHEG